MEKDQAISQLEGGGSGGARREKRLVHLGYAGLCLFLGLFLFIALKGLERTGDRAAQARASRLLTAAATAAAIGGLALGIIWIRRLDGLYEELDRLNWLEQEFLAIAAHDLRSPLCSVSGAAQLLANGSLGSLTDDQKRFVAVIHDESVRMTRLIELYLDLTRLESGQLTLAQEPLDLVELTRAHAQRLQTQFDERRVVLQVQVSADRLPLVGDGDRLTEVLDNLLMNALKFSPTGGTVRVGLVEASSRGVIVIADEGPGLTSEEIETIFEKFVKGRAGRRIRAGLGLGLAVSREIVKRHQGRLWAECEAPGRGARFVVELPLHWQS